MIQHIAFALAIQSLFVRHTQRRAVRWTVAATYAPRHAHARGAWAQSLSAVEHILRDVVIFSVRRVWMTS